MADRRPEVCVGAIAVDADQILLIRRGQQPSQGYWSVPGGRVEAGETLAEAVVRELREDASLEGVCGSLLGWTERIGPGYHFVILDFWVTIMTGREPRAGTDATEAAWVPLADVADLALVDGLAEFLHDHGVLRTFS